MGVFFLFEPEGKGGGLKGNGSELSTIMELFNFSNRFSSKYTTFTSNTYRNSLFSR